MTPNVSRSEGQRIRLRHEISRLRAIIDALELSLAADGIPPGPDVVETVAHAAIGLACSVSRLEAYMRAEEDAKS